MNDGFRNSARMEMSDENKGVEDCFYFLNSSCRKGDECVYRHSVEAKNSTVICPKWAATGRCTADCPMRHTNPQVARRKPDEMCYFETTEQGCTKPNCEFRHRNPAKNSGKYESLDLRSSSSKPWLSESVDESLSYGNLPQTESQKRFNLQENTNQEHLESEEEDAFYRNLQNENADLPGEISRVEQEIQRIREYTSKHSK